MAPILEIHTYPDPAALAVLANTKETTVGEYDYSRRTRMRFERHLVNLEIPYTITPIPSHYRSSGGALVRHWEVTLMGVTADIIFQEGVLHLQYLVAGGPKAFRVPTGKSGRLHVQSILPALVFAVQQSEAAKEAMVKENLRKEEEAKALAAIQAEFTALLTGLSNEVSFKAHPDGKATLMLRARVSLPRAKEILDALVALGWLGGVKS